MLIYSKDRLVPTDVNMLVLKSRDEEDRYFYIHRSLYDQAVILTDIYGDDKIKLIKDLTGQEQSRDDVDYFWDHTPTPVRIFAPYLLLVKEPLRKFKDMVGAIHVMSGPTNLRGLLKVDVAFRNNPQFSLSISEEYQLAWDRFFLTTMPYGTQMTMQPAMQPGWMPMNGTATVTAPLDAKHGTAAVDDDDEEVIEVTAANLDLSELSSADVTIPADEVLDLDALWDELSDMSEEEAKKINESMQENESIKKAINDGKKEKAPASAPAPAPVAPPVATPVAPAAPEPAQPAKMNMGLL